MIKEMFNNLVRVCLLAVPIVGSVAGDFTVKTGSQPAPEKIAEPIRAVLSSSPLQLLDDGKPVLQIWFRKEIPLKSRSSSPESVVETTLVAAVEVEGAGFRDYKQNDIPKGTYTARFVMQPQDGDHLGTAEFNTFVALIAADNDKSLDAYTKFTPTVKASGKLTSSGHPLIVSLRPVSSTEGTFPSISEPVPEHKAIRLKLAGKTSEGQSSDVVFDLVFQGHGHIQ